jgi:hypothetical protein
MPYLKIHFIIFLLRALDSIFALGPRNLRTGRVSKQELQETSTLKRIQQESTQLWIGVRARPPTAQGYMRHRLQLDVPRAGHIQTGVLCAARGSMPCCRTGCRRQTKGPCPTLAARAAPRSNVPPASSPASPTMATRPIYLQKNQGDGRLR